MNKRKLRDQPEIVNDPVAPHYEEDFEFPLWKMIRECAVEKDISFSQAAAEVEPVFSKTTKVRDQAYTDEQIRIGEQEGFTEARSVAIEAYKIES